MLLDLSLLVFIPLISVACLFVRFIISSIITLVSLSFSQQWRKVWKIMSALLIYPIKFFGKVLKGGFSSLSWSSVSLQIILLPQILGFISFKFVSQIKLLDCRHKQVETQKIKCNGRKNKFHLKFSQCQRYVMKIRNLQTGSVFLLITQSYLCNLRRNTQCINY